MLHNLKDVVNLVPDDPSNGYDFVLRSRLDTELVLTNQTRSAWMRCFELMLNMSQRSIIVGGHVGDGFSIARTVTFKRLMTPLASRLRLHFERFKARGYSTPMWSDLLEAAGIEQILTFVPTKWSSARRPSFKSYRLGASAKYRLHFPEMFADC